MVLLLLCMKSAVSIKSDLICLEHLPEESNMQASHMPGFVI